MPVYSCRSVSLTRLAEAPAGLFDLAGRVPSSFCLIRPPLQYSRESDYSCLPEVRRVREEVNVYDGWKIVFA